MFTWEFKSGDGKLTLIFRGEIDETADLGSLVAKLKEWKDPLAIDTYEVTRINSVGCTKWVGFIRDLSSIPHIELVRCSLPMVTQLNLIDNFRGHAKVRSVVTPFYCAKCDVEREEVVVIPDKLVSLPALVDIPQTCEAYGTQCESQFDDLVERYFSFLIR